MKWAVVVPTCRRDRYQRFYDAWRHLFVQHSVELITVWDEPPWAIPDFIPRRTDMIRSWGFYRAWENGAKYTLSLDDDVAPITDVFAEYERAFEREWACSPYLSVGALTDAGTEMRGFPYEHRGCQAAVQYGGWEGIPDLDAVTQLVLPPRGDSRFDNVCLPVPRGAPTTCCAMNFAFRTDLAPLMWQLPLLDGRYNRVGDIWSGLIQKRVLDAQGQVMLVNGKARVFHDRASDPFTNLAKEAPGLRHNEELWDALKGGTFLEVTDSFARFFSESDPMYAIHFRECRDQWLSLFAI